MNASLSWVNGTGQTGNRVERQEDGGAFATLATLGADVTAHVDSTLTAGHDYGYRVVAFNASGDGPASAVAKGSTKLPSGATGLTLVINLP